MKILQGTLLISFAFLVGCADMPPLTVTHYESIDIPDSLYNCPQIQKDQIPDPEVATNQDVANFITRLYRYNKICGISIDAIKKYEVQAKAINRINRRS